MAQRIQVLALRSWGGYVWGYCLNGSVKAIFGYLGVSGWACAVESSPSDVAILTAVNAGPELSPTNIGTALTDFSNMMTCTNVCFHGGVVGFGSNATATNQFSSGTYSTITAGVSSSLLDPISLGATGTLFNQGSTIGLLAGLEIGGSFDGLGDPISYGVGSLQWTVCQRPRKIPQIRTRNSPDTATEFPIGGHENSPDTDTEFPRYGHGSPQIRTRNSPVCLGQGHHPLSRDGIGKAHRLTFGENEMSVVH